MAPRPGWAAPAPGWPSFRPGDPSGPGAARRGAAWASAGDRWASAGGCWASAGGCPLGCLPGAAGRGPPEAQPPGRWRAQAGRQRPAVPWPSPSPRLAWARGWPGTAPSEPPPARGTPTWPPGSWVWRRWPGGRAPLPASSRRSCRSGRCSTGVRWAGTSGGAADAAMAGPGRAATSRPARARPPAWASDLRAGGGLRPGSDLRAGHDLRPGGDVRRGSRPPPLSRLTWPRGRPELAPPAVGAPRRAAWPAALCVRAAQDRCSRPAPAGAGMPPVRREPRPPAARILLRRRDVLLRRCLVFVVVERRHVSAAGRTPAAPTAG